MSATPSPFQLSIMASRAHAVRESRRVGTARKPYPTAKAVTPSATYNMIEPPGIEICGTTLSNHRCTVYICMCIVPFISDGGLFYTFRIFFSGRVSPGHTGGQLVKNNLKSQQHNCHTISHICKSDRADAEINSNGTVEKHFSCRQPCRNNRQSQRRETFNANRVLPDSSPHEVTVR